MQSAKKIIVGLGNPGKEFEATYHNVGILALRALASRLTGGEETALSFKTHKKIFSYAAAGDLVLVVPLTFMNTSGIAVKEALKKFAASSEDLIVLHDESDLPIGTYRIAKERGAAGHKGVQSIVDTLHKNDFTRVRIGIRERNEEKRKKASAFVLQTITPKDKKILEGLFQDIAEDIQKLL